MLEAEPWVLTAPASHEEDAAVRNAAEVFESAAREPATAHVLDVAAPLVEAQVEASVAMAGVSHGPAPDKPFVEQVTEAHNLQRSQRGVYTWGGFAFTPKGLDGWQENCSWHKRNE
ncbi:MAG: hypothetical protein ACKPKO_51355, partial [Candidatus Fonsibacter sp.]